MLLLIATAASLWRRRGPERLADELFLLVPLAFYAIYFNLLFRAQIGFRFVLVCLPLLYVLTGGLLRADRAATSRLRRLLVGGAVTASVASVLWFHPHYVSYVNELVLDRNRAFRLFADSNLDYGQSDGYFEEFRARHPEVILEPETPVAGLIGARVNWLTGISPVKHDTWLGRNFEPIGHVGRSYLLFEVSAEDVAALAASATAPAASPTGAPEQ